MMTIGQLDVTESLNGLFGQFVVNDHNGFPTTYKLEGAPHGSWLMELNCGGAWQATTSLTYAKVMPLLHKAIDLRQPSQAERPSTPGDTGEELNDYQRAVAATRALAKRIDPIIEAGTTGPIDAVAIIKESHDKE